MIILAIETSCDDTSVAIVSVENGNNRDKLTANSYQLLANFKVLANLVSSQVNIHKKWGGIVPNLASRAHSKNLPIVFKQALKKAKIKTKDISVIAVTIGPGLSPSLLIGVHFARALAYKYDKPIIPINHIEGHIYSNFLKKIGELKANSYQLIANSFPIINLVVSGGHTSLYLMKGHSKYQLIGETRDDAAGEAFDKVAKMLGLGYPGGPIISALAESYKLTANSYELTLPRPMINSNNFDFSFSGLKTAVFYLIKKIETDDKFRIEILDGIQGAARSELSRTARYGERAPQSATQKTAKISILIKQAIAYEFQQSVIDILISKTMSAAKKYGTKTIAISGGVSANDQLRKQFEQKAKENGITFVMPPKNMSTDNALMIAIAGYYNWLIGKKTSWNKIDANPNLKLL